MLKTISHPPLRWDRVNLSQHNNVIFFRYQDADMRLLRFLSGLASIGFVWRECRRRAFPTIIVVAHGLIAMPEGIAGKIRPSNKNRITGSRAERIII